VNVFYIYITIALASALFVLGALFRSLCGKMESPVFRTALRMMTFTYCFFGTVNLLELWNRAFMPDTCDVLLFQTSTLVVAVMQAFLFTYTLILLIHVAYVTRKRVTRELVPIVSLSVVFLVVCFTLPDNWVKISVYLFILFYVYLIVRYTRLFVITYRDCLRKMDNYFSGLEAEHLQWVKFSFYAALSIGMLALSSSLFPAIRIGIFCSVVYFLFYVYFAFRFINYGFVYKKLEHALADDDGQSTQQKENKNALPPSIASTIKPKLENWLEEKLFLQPGVTVDEIALQIGTNQKYLSVYFNQYMNKPFRTWINELRIEEAKRLLIDYPDMTIKQISDKAGFSRNSYFWNLFLKNAGQTPLAWRKTRLEKFEENF